MTFPLRGHHKTRTRIDVSIASTQNNFNLATELIANHKSAGVNWPADVYVVLNSGVVLGAITTGVGAFLTGDLYNAPGTGESTFVQLTNNGTIRGAGGNGGGGGIGNANPATSGSKGGDALFLGHDLTVINDGIVSGGGGGGGGGGSQNEQRGGASGGGGGAGSSQVGSGGSGNCLAGDPVSICGSNNGAPGTATVGGQGGNQGPGDGIFPAGLGGDGGNGGNQGVAGQAGEQVLLPGGGQAGVGGAAGFYEKRNGWTLTWSTTGTRYGSAG